MLISSGVCKAQTNSLAETEVNTMRRTYADTGGTDMEVIKILTAISKVSARMARNLSLLADQRQSKEGGTFHEQNERTVTDHRRIAQCCCRY